MDTTATLAAQTEQSGQTLTVGSRALRFGREGSELRGGAWREADRAAARERAGVTVSRHRSSLLEDGERPWQTCKEWDLAVAAVIMVIAARAPVLAQVPLPPVRIVLAAPSA